mmetsp:Transcript_81533/g.251676  ORF Transcript_81533/g.251676 Transcript_81533/m.251676 type:complete len:300 (+) Transcript_81533:758-1657(+)
MSSLFVLSDSAFPPAPSASSPVLLQPRGSVPPSPAGELRTSSTVFISSQMPAATAATSPDAATTPSSYPRTFSLVTAASIPYASNNRSASPRQGVTFSLGMISFTRHSSSAGSSKSPRNSCSRAAILASKGPFRWTSLSSGQESSAWNLLTTRPAPVSCWTLSAHSHRTPTCSATAAGTTMVVVPGGGCSGCGSSSSSLASSLASSWATSLASTLATPAVAPGRCGCQLPCCPFAAARCRSSWAGRGGGCGGCGGSGGCDALRRGGGTRLGTGRPPIWPCAGRSEGGSSPDRPYLAMAP